MEKIMYHGKELFSPKLDLVFKALFGTEDSKDILRSFLNAVLDLDIKSTDDIELTNTEVVGEQYTDKVSRLDVCAKVRNSAKDDEIIDIEIQLNNDGNIMKRSVYYVAKLFVSQLEKGKIYDELGRAIGLSILDFNIFDDNRFFHRGRLKDVETTLEFTDCFELNFVEIPKLPTEAKTLKELWLMLLRATTEKEIDMLANQSIEIANAVDKLERVSTSQDLKIALIMKEKAERDWDNRLANSVAKAKQQGMQQGMQQGIIATARAMKQLGISLDKIIKATGLSVEEIEKL